MPTPIHPRVASELHLAQLLREGEVTPDLIRFFGNNAVLAAYDRKVTRDYMISVINLNAQLSYALLKLSKAGTARLMFEKLGRADCELLDAAADGIVEDVGKLRGKLADKVTELAECPNEGDIIS